MFIVLYCNGLEHPQSLVSVGGPGTNHFWILKDDCTFCLMVNSLGYEG